MAYLSYLLSEVFGVTLSYHRNLIHRSFILPKYLEYLFAFALHAYQVPIFVICELDATPPKVIDFTSPPEDADLCNKFYLVEMFGDLHLVEQAISYENNLPLDEFHFDTDYFSVYKFDFQSRTWEELENLGDHGFFVGNNTSSTISTASYPQFKSNSVYFTTNDTPSYESKKWCHVGVYDMEDTIEPINFRHDQLSKFSGLLFFLAHSLMQ